MSAVGGRRGGGAPDGERRLVEGGADVPPLLGRALRGAAADGLTPTQKRRLEARLSALLAPGGPVNAGSEGAATAGAPGEIAAEAAAPVLSSGSATAAAAGAGGGGLAAKALIALVSLSALGGGLYVAAQRTPPARTAPATVDVARLAPPPIVAAPSERPRATAAPTQIAPTVTAVFGPPAPDDSAEAPAGVRGAQRAKAEAKRTEKPLRHRGAQRSRAVTAPVRDPRPTPAPPSPIAAPLDELRQLERAQALAKRSPDDAVALLRDHERRYPASSLSQEREVITIEALARLGRTEEARARAARFIAAHPRSALRRRVERTLP